MKIICKSCGVPVKSNDINIDLAIAKCSSCHAVFGFAEDVQGSASSGSASSDSSARQERERGEVPMPSAFTMRDDGADLIIQRRWFSFVHVFLIFFCVAWNGFLIFWFSMVLSEDVPWIFAVFPIIHVAVGVGLTYFTIAGFVNKTTIEIGSGKLRVRHRPLPWLGNHNLDARDLDQLYCVEKMRRGKNSTYYTYNVMAKMRDGKGIKVFSNLTDVEQALFLEQQIEKRLGIRNRPMPGEVPR